MNDEAAFQQAMQEHPEDNSLRLVFADWLEERGDQRGELIRVLHTLTQSVTVKGRKKIDEKLRGLLSSGVVPVGPFWTNSIGMKFGWIPAGTFQMGSPEKEEGRKTYEVEHKVTLTRGFWLAVHLVTQASWRKLMGKNSCKVIGNDLPVDNISWHECQEFLLKLGKQENQTYRLPTEAEWEYACRAGTTTPFSTGITISTDQANYNGKFPYGKGQKGLNRAKTSPVGSFRPNGWGLYDMHGNLMEMCLDWFGPYPQSAVTDPQGVDSGQDRVLRGGAFNNRALNLRSAYRIWGSSYGCDVVGFRPVQVIPK